jgi:hypothetical protein
VSLLPVRSLEDAAALSDYDRQHRAVLEQGMEALRLTAQHDYVLYGGAKGGGKTVTGVRIIQHCIANYAGGVYVVMRQNYTDLHRTTVQSFERFFPPSLVVSKTTNLWQCASDNQIWFYAADRSRDRNYEKTRGLEATGVFFDEASQGDDDLYEVLPSLLRRDAHHRITGEPLRKFVYLTTNPVSGSNYLRRHFVDPTTRDPRNAFVRALPDDNPMLPASYIASAFSRMSEPMLRMLRYGDWDVEESDLCIVPRAALAAVVLDVDFAGDRAPVAAGVDVGLGRPDVTVVVCANRAGEMWVESEFAEYDTVAQASALRDVCTRVAANRGWVCIDAGAVGKGLADMLIRSHGATVQPVQFSESAVQEYTASARTARYRNRRAQLYFWLREDVMNQSVRIAAHDGIADDLANTFYLAEADRQAIEPKDRIKERLGRSPDYADALVLCNAARRSVTAAARAAIAKITVSAHPRRTTFSRFQL